MSVTNKLKIFAKVSETAEWNPLDTSDTHDGFVAGNSIVAMQANTALRNASLLSYLFVDALGSYTTNNYTIDPNDAAPSSDMIKEMIAGYINSAVNANSASKLLTEKTLTFTINSGKNMSEIDIIGSTNNTFDGSVDKTWNITLANSGAIADAYGDYNDQTPAFNTTFKVPYIRVNDKGIVTDIRQHTVKIPSSSDFTTKSTLSASGDMYYANGANNPAALHIGTNGQYLMSDGTKPVWTTFDTKTLVPLETIANNHILLSVKNGLPKWSNTALSSSSIKPLYLSGTGVLTAASKYAGGTSVNLNGTSKGADSISIYAPVVAGSSINGLDTLFSDANGIPSWSKAPWTNITKGTGKFVTTDMIQGIDSNNVIHYADNADLFAYTKQGFEYNSNILNIFSSIVSNASNNGSASVNKERRWTWRCDGFTAQNEEAMYLSITSGRRLLQVNGNIATSGTITSSSDRRLKERIKTYESKQSILDLTVYEYDYKDSKQHTIGCMAQDLQKICPEIVHEGTDGYLTIEESKIVYLLLNEVKRLSRELDELKHE